jgi:hypothetical protein
MLQVGGMLWRCEATYARPVRSFHARSAKGFPRAFTSFTCIIDRLCGILRLSYLPHNFVRLCFLDFVDAVNVDEHGLGYGLHPSPMLLNIMLDSLVHYPTGSVLW